MGIPDAVFAVFLEEWIGTARDAGAGVVDLVDFAT
jgi:hypothetical protein